MNVKILSSFVFSWTRFLNVRVLLAVLKKSTIGDTVIIGNKSYLKETIVFNNAKIGDNVILSNCVIGENCEINDGCKLKYAVVGDNEIIKEKTIIENNIIWTQPKPKEYPDKQIGNAIIN